MPAVVPRKTSTIATAGDLLKLGTFVRPGSPAPDKEPYFAFYRESDPYQVVSLRNGSIVRVSSHFSVFDGFEAVYLTYSIDPKTLRKAKDSRFIFFPNTLQEVSIETNTFPPGFAVRVLTSPSS